MLEPLKNAFASHPRRWREFRYVYPVISRRSQGLSIGINLCPSGSCSFHCTYCSVERESGEPAAEAPVDLAQLEAELRHLVATRAQLFDEPGFRGIPPAFQRLNDLAFSGDGEPTLSPAFPAAVNVAAAVRHDYGLADVKLVLITNASGLAQPAVVAALRVLDQHNGEIWAKLDAGTEEYFRQVNRAGLSLQQIIDNLLAAARVRPIVLQSMFLRLHGQPPPPPEIAAYVERVRGLLAGGARIALVQLYTVARHAAEAFVDPLSAVELGRIADTVRPLGVPVAVFP
jgi:wyosine [tRNA(Phe)-imidazoG37] synthetase (radical SAM superfamily)